MNWSKKVSGVLGMLTVLAVFIITSPSVATAYEDCSRADVLKAGPNAYGAGDPVVQIKCLSDGTWGKNGIATLSVHPDIADQVLATGLTALSLGKTVWIRASDKTGGAMIYIMYINK